MSSYLFGLILGSTGYLVGYVVAKHITNKLWSDAARRHNFVQTKGRVYQVEDLGPTFEWMKRDY